MSRSRREISLVQAAYWKWVTVLACSLSLSRLVHAENATVSEADWAMRAMILKQLDAIQRDNGPEAFGLNTPRLRDGFGTPEKFMRMVRRSFTELYHADSVHFVHVTTMMDQGMGLDVQALAFKGSGGEQMVAVYEMKEVRDGVWRVDRCTLRTLSGVAQ